MVSLSKRGFHTDSKGLDKSLIWVYDINNLSENLYGLVEGAPFKTKTECAKILAISRSTVLAYLDKGKLLNNKLIFSSPLGELPSGEVLLCYLKRNYLVEWFLQKSGK